MNKYKKYILSIIIALLSVIIMYIVWIVLDNFLKNKPWSATVIFISCLTSVIHIISGLIYDKKDNLSISKRIIGCIFLISIISQIVCTIIVVFNSFKRFGSIHPIEYIIGAIFMLMSVYFFRNASYKLIDKENNK